MCPQKGTTKAGAGFNTKREEKEKIQIVPPNEWVPQRRILQKVRIPN